jgi:CubicO group peptidase (beta-lactamase class C family)
MSTHQQGESGKSLDIGRRGLLIGTGAAVAGLLLPRPVAAAGARAAAAAALVAQPFVAYHGVTGAVHQQRFTDLVARGFRMISLSVFDRTPLYAAVWVQRAGPAFIAFHGLSAEQYQAKFNEVTPQGFVPVLISATGPRNGAIFAGVFEKTGDTFWMARHGIDDAALAGVNQSAQNIGLIPRTVAVYGTGAGDRTYAGVWLPNKTATKWQHGFSGNGTEHQAWFDAYAQVPMRPAFLDANDGLQYAALFTDDSVGGWVARHGMTSADYQAEFDRQNQLGRMPIYVQGGGIGAGVRYAALFAAQDTAVARLWTQTNAGGTGFTGVHDVVKSFMRARGIRAGVLSVRKAGASVLSAGYTWAEPGYPITQPASLMRLASVSKAFTAAAIRALVTDKKLDLAKPVFPLLGITSVAVPGQTKDSRIDTVTVQQCVDHTGGWDRTVSGGIDPVFQGRAIANALGLTTHASKRDVARYMYGLPLQFGPGTKSVYSNFGYVLLALVVEQVSGLSFQDYLKQRVLQPLGVDAQVWTGATVRSGRRGTEVSYDAPAVDLSAWNPQSAARVPVAYGSFLIAEMDGGGGLIASAPAVTAFTNKNAVFGGMGDRAPGAARAGEMPGTVSWAKSRTGDLDWCFIFNTDEPAALTQFPTDLDNAIGAAGF